MDVGTIEVPVKQAREKVEQYKDFLRKRADVEAEAALAAYEQCAKGKKLIDVRDAIESAGLDELGRPRLAIARADRQQVICEFETRHRDSGTQVDEGARFTSTRLNKSAWNVRSTTRENPTLRLTIKAPAWRGTKIEHSTLYAQVPGMPPKVKNKVRTQGRLFHVLWEVESWSTSPIGAQMSVDPFLLRHVHGTLYAVEAEWELTELERRVIEAIRTE